jgi:hypothetical protein
MKHIDVSLAIGEKDQMIWPSYEVHMVDALADAVDEGRGKLR